MVYLGIGFLIGPAGTGFLSMTLPDHVTRLRITAEIALLISLFAIGLRLRVPPADRRWMLPLRLGAVAMIFTVASIAVLGVLVLHLSLGVAVLLGAMIAPTDPVLAHDVGVRDAGDVELVRFSLSGEGGINDGTAYRCAVLGLLLCGSGPTSELPVLDCSESISSAPLSRAGVSQPSTRMPKVMRIRQAQWRLYRSSARYENY